jgi:two-component system C4-dicarboxylate transport response regulator DctD
MIEMAHGGTLFLDEIESMPLSMQAKLLRVLEDRKVQRLGGQRTYDIDMRVIAATNVPAEELVRNGQMRSDFYYRINVVRIPVIPLRERRADIPLLVQHFVQQHPIAAERGITRVSQNVMNQLMRYTWPGNVRELQNVLEKAVVLSHSATIKNVDLPIIPQPVPFPQWIKEQEKKYLTQQLEAFQGRVEQTATNCGMCSRTLFRKMRRYGLDKKKFRPWVMEGEFVSRRDSWAKKKDS